MLGLAVILFSSEAVAAYDSTVTKPIRTNNQIITATLTATHEIPNISNHVVAVVMQPGQDQIHAFNALTGEWATLGGIGFRVDADDIAVASNLVILVAQPAQEQLHGYSALTGEWATLRGADFRVDPDDIFKVNDSLIVVAQPGQEQLHAYSALTGEWATLGGVGFNVTPNDVVLVGTEN